MKKTRAGFSFVELVVSISILTILSAISFVSFGQYLKNSRDSQRITDISSIKLALKIHRQRYGVLPPPANAVAIQTGSLVVASQWVLDDTVGVMGLGTAPKDPKALGAYLYSISANRREYQISATLENDKVLSAKVDGDYRVVAKNILPSLVFAYSGAAALDISVADNQSRFILDGSESALPYDFSPSPTPVYKSTQTLANLLSLYGKNILTSSLYNSCTEIYNAGKSVGTGSYSIINSSGALSSTECCMSAGVLAACNSIVSNIDPYAGNVVSLMHFEGNLADDIGKVWTPNGGTTTSTAQKKFGDNSILFDGIDDYVSASDSDDFFFGAAPTFSADFWFYPTATQPDYATFFAQESDVNNLFVLDYGASGKLRIVSMTAWAVTGEVSCSSAPALVTNTWNHIYYGANSGIPYIGANGTLCSLAGSPTTFSGLGNIASSTVVWYRPTQAGRYVKGYIDEFRVTKWIARWTAAFTPPTVATTIPVGSIGSYAANVVSLLHFDGNLADEKGKTWTVAGSATTNATDKKFGAGALELVSSSSQYISTPASTDFDFATGDFTIDFWAKARTGWQGAYATFGSNSSDGNSNGGFWFEIGTARAPNFYYKVSASAVFGSSVLTISAAGFEHFELCRSSGNMYMFRNGVPVWASSAFSHNISSAVTFKLGAYGGTGYSNALIDEYRVTKGICRHTTSFTPPTAASSSY